MAELLKAVYIPDDVLQRLQESVARDQERLDREKAIQKQRLEQTLESVRRKMDQAYSDKLEGKIPEDFWERKMNDWRSEEQQILSSLSGLKESTADRVLSAQKIFELANKAYFLYLKQPPAEQAKLLRLVLSNCAIDGVSLYPTYRKPFDLICRRARNEEWST